MDKAEIEKTIEKTTCSVFCCLASHNHEVPKVRHMGRYDAKRLLTTKFNLLGELVPVVGSPPRSGWLVVHVGLTAWGMLLASTVWGLALRITCVHI